MEKFKKFVETIEILRGPNGCPWDKKQTLKSMKGNLLEETYEVIEAIDNDNWEELKSELGDLLLQVVFLSNIAKEKGKFNIEDVIVGIDDKMKRRHPHIFSDLENNLTADEVLRNWEKIKKDEDIHRDRESLLDGIPESFPALLKAEKVQKKVARVGFDWDSYEEIIEKVEEELEELKIEVNNSTNKIEEEMGDLLFTVVNLSRYLKINPELCLDKAVTKFKDRFKYIEEKCDIMDTDREKLNKLWEESKKRD